MRRISKLVERSRGGELVGIQTVRGKYRVYISSKKRGITWGDFKTPESAWKQYQKFKKL